MLEVMKGEKNDRENRAAYSRRNNMPAEEREEEICQSSIKSWTIEMRRTRKDYSHFSQDTKPPEHPIKLPSSRF